MKVLGISGSLRRDSHNRGLLLEAAKALPAGVEFELYDRLGALPHYDEDADVQPADPEVQALRDAIADADAVLFATPEYNGSVPGALKNAIDWASRPRGNAALDNKPVAVIGTSTGSFGGVWAQADLRRILKTARARVIEHEVAVPKAHERLAETGRFIHDEPLDELVEALLAEVRPARAAAAA
jgi:chromate reductase, NAD(P)H dehydrogenase (quinone)